VPLALEVVEKDYVLRWMLAGLAHLPLGQWWVFNGPEF
jgi:hypothetical protein